MEESITLPTWARNGLIGIGLFLLGGLLAFGYSYRPLHGALTWKVDQLEARIDERNLENLKLSDEIARLRADESTKVDPDAFAKNEAELAKIRTELEQSKKDLARTDRKRKDANASASRWRKRYEKLRDETAVAAKAPEIKAESAVTSVAQTPPSNPGPTEKAAEPAQSPAAPSPTPTETGILPSEPASPSTP